MLGRVTLDNIVVETVVETDRSAAHSLVPLLRGRLSYHTKSFRTLAEDRLQILPVLARLPSSVSLATQIRLPGGSAGCGLFGFHIREQCGCSCTSCIFGTSAQPSY